MPRPKKNKQAGAAFKELLKEKGFSNSKLAKAIGMGAGHIGRIASGEIASPTPATLEKIAAELGVELGELTMIFAQSPVRSHSAEVPQPQEEAQEETVSKNTDFVGREEAIAKPPPENDLDKLVQKVRSHFHNEIQYRCGTLALLNDVSDTSWSVRLEDICIEDIKVKDESNRFASNQEPQTPVHWRELALTQRRLMVLGKPGAGKTTLLQHIALQCDQGNFRPELVPIFIRLKSFAEDARDAGRLSLLDYISQEYCSDGVSKQELENLFKSGRTLILLDGLDEVPAQDTDEVLKQIRRLLDKPFDNQIIITCRKAAQEYLDNRFQEFAPVEVADFGKEQIEIFVGRWFKTFPENSPPQGEHKTNQFLKRLPENEKIQELAGTPLLLHLICFVFQETDDFPSKRSDLYRDALNLLLTKWNKFNKGIQLNQSERELLIKQLSQIAAITFEKGEFSFKLDRIQQILEQSDLASEDWLKSIELRHGILVKRGRGTYSFSHQTFQEYFTAKALATCNDPKVLEKLASRIADPRWREVFLLVAEILPNTEKLLWLMQEEVNKLVANKQLQDFLTWGSRKAKKITTPWKSAVIRACYFFIAIEGDFTSAFSLIKAIDNNCDRELDRIYYLTHNSDIDMDLILARPLGCDLDLSLSRVLVNTLDCDLDLNLSRFLVNTLGYSDKPIIDLTPDIVRFFNAWLSQSAFYESKNIDYALEFDINPQLEQILHQVKKEIRTINSFEERKTMNIFFNKKLRELMMKYHDIGYDWQFSKDQGELIKHYGNGSELLADCLNSASIAKTITTEVRSHIEDTLLLPIAEIEKRRLGD